MAATALLSRHSSNPLEVSSSDTRNRAYLKELMHAQQMARPYGGEPQSSDDPLNDLNLPELERYHTHLAQLYPNAQASAYQYGASTSKAPGKDTDEDMFSDGDSDGEEMEQDQEEEEEEEEEEHEDEGADTDEELTIYLKSRDEQAEIEEEIADLANAVPELTEDYKIIDRLGTGTFSAVYKAIDLGYHTKWHNAEWHGNHPPSSSAYYQSTPYPPGSKVFVAIKRIYVTSGPERIRNELMIMEDCRGCRHVSQLITAFRCEDQVVAIMPYHKNDDFRQDYFRYLPLEGVKAYFRCMFRALRDIHIRGIIHRDVKPANFLFDPRTGIGTLCDFGLACVCVLDSPATVCASLTRHPPSKRVERGQSLGSCLHTPPSREHPHGRLKPRTEYDIDHIKRMQKEGRIRSAGPSDKVGYPEKDTRPHSKANRAGTRGFRAPEVLLKCGEQTGAIDVWSAGVILLFFLTKKFPVFHSGDDTEALMEIATVIGRRKMEKTATLHSRLFQSNVPTLTQDGMSWREFVERQNPDLRTPPEPEYSYYPYTLPEYRQRARPPPSSSSCYSPGRSSPSSQAEARAPSPTPSERDQYAAEIEHALDFLEKAMEPESIRRMTPRAALKHPFLHEPGAPDDDECAPHPFGDGVCGHLHSIDEEEELCVKVRVEGCAELVERRVRAGEGIAIGRRPCEFHRDMPEFKQS